MTLVPTHLEVADLIDELPPLNDTVTRLVTLTSDPGATADDVADLLMRDGVLTGELLAEANSSLFASTTPARSVSDAIIRLGMIRVVAVAVRIDTQRATRTLPGGPVDPNQILTHHMHAVEAAVALCKHVGNVDRNSLVTTAVLHDVGKLVLSRMYSSRPDLAEIIGDEAIELELELLEVHHGEVGRVVCEHWSIPDDIGIAIQYHHKPLGQDALAHATYLVDVLSHLAVAEESDEVASFTYVPDCLDYLGLSSSNFDAALKQTRRAIFRS